MVRINILTRQPGLLQYQNSRVRQSSLPGTELVLILVLRKGSGLFEGLRGMPVGSREGVRVSSDHVV